MVRKIIPGGLYRHYKNNWYFVIGESTDTESRIQYVTYFPLYLDDMELFVREKTMFLEDIEENEFTSQKERFLESGKTELTIQDKITLLEKADRLLSKLGLSIMRD